MNIDFKWVANDACDKDYLDQFCDTNKSKEFCWWISIDLINDSKSFKDIINLINRAEVGSSNVWRGNSHRLEISPKGIILFDPRVNIKYEYTLSEFKDSMNDWYTAISDINKQQKT